MRANKVLTMAAIEELQEQNIEVKVVKFDGAATNVSTAQKLGCNSQVTSTTLNTER